MFTSNVFQPTHCSLVPLFPLPSPHLRVITADEFATLCGSQRPGFVIDIYTGLPVGEL